MRPISFKESNKTLLKPESMTDEECFSLDVFTDGEVCISCWKPTLRERLSLLIFGKIWIWVVSGSTQPPIVLDAKRTVFRKNETRP